MLKISFFFLFLFILLPLAFGQNLLNKRDYIIEYEFLNIENGLPSRDVFCVAQDKKGFIWFGSKNGLCRYDGKNFKYFTTKEGLQSNYVVNIYVDNQNHIFIAYSDQWVLNQISDKYDVIDANSFKITTYKKFLKKNLPPKFPDSFIKLQYVKFSSDSIEKNKTISFCKNQGIKIGDIDKVSLYSFDDKNKIITSPEGVFLIENKRIYKILETLTLSLYGFNIFRDLFKDANNTIWLCANKGVYKIKIKPNYFKTYFTTEELKKEPDPQARGIFVSTSEGNKSITAHIGGVFLKKSNKIESIITLPPGWGVIQIKDQLYLSTPNQLNIFQAKSLKMIQSVPLPFKKDGYVNYIFQKNESTLLLGRDEDIISFDLNNHVNYLLSYKSSQIPKVKKVYRIFNTSKGIIAQAENGLFLIQNNQIVDYFGPFAKDKKKYLPIKCMHDAHEDKNHDIWIATNGQGLFKWEWNKQAGNAKIVNYTISEGLQSMLLYRIEEDEDDNLWISSDDGLIRFNKTLMNFQLFTIKDGLSNDEFNRGSSFKAKDGQIYFGCINGIVAFDPKQIKINKIKEAPFQMLSIMKYGNEGEKELLSSFLKNKRIELYHGDNLIRFEFVLLDYSPRLKKYSYRIKGVQDKWISITSRSITLGQLPAGEYMLEIKAELDDGSWQKQILEVPIFMTPPFYMKTWFIVILFLLFLQITFGIIWYRSRLQKAQKRRLEKIIIERTEDLQRALGDKDILLKELHHRVKNNLQIVTGLLDLQKARMTDKKAIEALDEGKIRLSSIALIHQNFYRGTNLETISFKIFLTDLVIAVKQLFENEHRIINCVIQSDDIPIDINIAIPLGLIVNELLTNSYKYLPAEQSDKRIEVNLAILENGKYEFTYRDNGPGLPPNMDFENSHTLGLRLISGLTEQINGSINYSFERGSVFVIQFNSELNK